VFLNSQSLAYRVVPVYSRLMRYKTGDDTEFGQTIIEPDLAERWDVAKDGKTYTFHLRKGIKWQNMPPVNGRELTADDVIFSYNRLWKTIGSGQAPWFNAVDSIQAVDKYTVRVNMKQPSATFLVLMAHAWAFIHPKEVVERDGDVRKQTIGSGPFIMTKRQRDVKTELRRNPDYFMPGLPHLDGVDVFYIPDPTANRAAFIARQLDWNSFSEKPDIEAIYRSRPDAVLAQKYLGLSYCKFHFKTDEPPFNDDKLRKAISLTIDRQSEIDTFWGGEGAPFMMLPLGWKGIALEPEQLGQDNYWKRDLKRARQLLEQGGYPIPYEVPFLHNLLFDKRVALYVNHLNESGLFKLKVKAMTREEYLAGAYVGNFPPGFAFTKGCGPLALEPGQMLNALYHPSQTVANNSRVNDPVLTKMIEDQDAILDSQERVKKLHEIQRYAASKMYYVPTTQGFSLLFRDPKIMNLRETFGFNMGDVWQRVWIKK